LLLPEIEPSLLVVVLVVKPSSSDDKIGSFRLGLPAIGKVNQGMANVCKTFIAPAMKGFILLNK